MPSPAITTVAKMMEPLPTEVQQQVVEHLREDLQEIEDESAWDELFERSQDQFIAAARRARQEIAQGHAEPLDIDKL